MKKIIPAGNEFISLPEINEAACTVDSISFLLMAQRGMVELRGSENHSLVEPFLAVDGDEIALDHMAWSRVHYWIPVAEKVDRGLKIQVTFLAPVGERGFGVRLCVDGLQENSTVEMGVRGKWSHATHCVNEDKPLEGTMHCYESAWNSSLVFDYRMGFPAFAFAPICGKPLESLFFSYEDGIEYSLAHHTAAKKDGHAELTIYFGFGFEEVAAATSAKEMLRRGWEHEFAKTAAFLSQREKVFAQDAITRIYNTNLFFCLFYSTGLTLDTEELVCMTSRSKRYYVSAAYWDRDSLLWSFLAILGADPRLARNVLTYVFTRQSRNIGVHSRYIDGTVLEPGFELDELLAPVLALKSYTDRTADRKLKNERYVTDSMEHILAVLAEMKHPLADLYETFLQPTDDEIVYKYLTYDNMLVWKAMKALAELYPERYSHLAAEAEKVRTAIYENCVFTDAQGCRYFGWSVDLEGHHDVYDEPPGSLQLLPYYGFCTFEDEIWQHTVEMIRSPAYPYSFSGFPIAEIGCPHAPQPWVLSLCNSLLCGHAGQAFRELETLKMDNGIACESVDAVTGECTTGAAFATCAGFLCHAIAHASEELK
ncbi:MAG: glycoside hydrolase family 125 protein [Oscillospiraceae bacterium]|nr:glycoside hydrolase family 125 protein [Oscillospiraceae bacterium]